MTDIFHLINFAIFRKTATRSAGPAVAPVASREVGSNTELAACSDIGILVGSEAHPSLLGD